MKLAAIAALVVASSGVAHAAEDFGKGTVIFARGQALYRIEATGKNETVVANFVTKAPVRAMKTDALGKTLIVDIGGTWGWMPLDGSTKTILSLACAEGPAQITEDGGSVVCKSPKRPGATMVIDLAAQTAIHLDVPHGHVVGAGATRTIIWADKGGVWSAPLNALARKKLVGPDAPLRAFAPSHDGLRAVAVWADQVYATLRVKKPAEILMGVQLDGVAARRRMIKSAIPVEWSHDSKWILAQDAEKACMMEAQGGQYKCWRGYTAVSVAPDGRWSLMLGNRDPKAAKTTKKATPPKPGKTGTGPKPGTTSGKPGTDGKPASDDDDPGDDDDDAGEGAEGDGDVEDDPVADVPVALPTGPLALYRGRLEGPFTEAPALLVKIVDGAAVWVPAKP